MNPLKMASPFCEARTARRRADPVPSLVPHTLHASHAASRHRTVVPGALLPLLAPLAGCCTLLACFADLPTILRTQAPGGGGHDPGGCRRCTYDSQYPELRATVLLHLQEQRDQFLHSMQHQCFSTRSATLPVGALGTVLYLRYRLGVITLLPLNGQSFLVLPW